MSKIEWTNETWNVTTGCTRASAGCDNCYAVAMTKRLANMEATEEKYGGLVNEGKNHFNGKIKLHEDELEKPLRWRKPRKVFVNSMSDLFHPDVPFKFIATVFGVMSEAVDHTFQVLTKRPERMAEFFRWLEEQWEINELGKKWEGKLDSNILMWWAHEYGIYADEDYQGSGAVPKLLPLKNVWLGTSVENQEAADERIQHLLQCPAAVRFLSCEPLLGEVNFRWTSWSEQSEGLEYREYLEKHGSINQYEGLRKINWVIVGGESGHNARPIHPEWARTIRDQCKDAGVPFFFKQWGNWAPGSNYGKNEKLILKDGSVYRNPAPRNHIMMIYSESEWNDQEPNVIHKSTKKEAGRLLDGEEYNEFPETERKMEEV